MTKPTKADIELAQRLNNAARRTPAQWRAMADRYHESSRKLFEMGDMRVESYQHARELADGVAQKAELSAIARRLRSIR